MDLKLNVLLIIMLSISYSVQGHEGHANPNSVKACHEKELSNSCEYILGKSKLYKGTCRLMSEKMMCVRNQPIEVLKNKVEQSKDKAKEKVSH
jgi:hypothetical protein